MSKSDPTVHSIPVTRSLDYALALPESSEGAPLVIGLHGWGQSCRSFLRKLQPLTDAGFAVAVPQAPHQFYVSMDPKKVGFSWLTMYERDRSVSEFTDDMARLIEDVKSRYGVDTSRVFIIGFSQGVSMAHRFAVSGKADVAAIAACAADLPPDVEEQLPAPYKYPVLIVHAHEDPIIPWEKGDAAAKAITLAGHPVDVHRFEGGHTLPPEVMRHIGEWFSAQRVTES